MNNCESRSSEERGNQLEREACSSKIAIDRGLWNNESGRGNDWNRSRSPRRGARKDDPLSSLDPRGDTIANRGENRRADPRTGIKLVPISRARKRSLIFSNGDTRYPTRRKVLARACYRSLIMRPGLVTTELRSATDLSASLRTKSPRDRPITQP